MDIEIENQYLILIWDLWNGSTKVGSDGWGNKREKQSGAGRTPFKRMTESEMENKKAKGLCFQYGDEEADDYHEDEEHAHLYAVEVSAHSVLDITTPHTMKLWGTIQGYEVGFLIDSGATHNFLSVRLVEPLGLRVTGKLETGLTLGNGKTKTSSGICRGVEFNLQGHRVTEDSYSLDLGEPGLRRTEESLRSLARAIPDISETYLIALTRVEDTSTMVTKSMAEHSEHLRTVVASEYKRWVSKLSGYDFKIVYRPRSKNGAADALSRRGGDYEFLELMVARISSDTSLLEAVRDDSEIVELRIQGTVGASSNIVLDSPNLS
nr:hypothetical protein [Tanacetum cinerariifolium]